MIETVLMRCRHCSRLLGKVRLLSVHAGFRSVQEISCGRCKKKSRFRETGAPTFVRGKRRRRHGGTARSEESPVESDK